MSDGFMGAKDELEELIDELAEEDPAIRSRIAAALERRELRRDENEFYAKPENQEPQGPPRRRHPKRT